MANLTITDFNEFDASVNFANELRQLKTPNEIFEGVTKGNNTVISFPTTSDMENLSINGEDLSALILTGQRAENRERANAQYVLAAAGYVAQAGDITAANGRVWELQINGQVLSGWFSSLEGAVARSRNILVTQDYVLDAGLGDVDCTDESFLLDLNGHTLTSSSVGGVMSAFGSLTNITNVISHAGSTITVDAASPILSYLQDNIGDRPIIKIVSEDAIDENESLAEKKGEHVRVKGVSGGVIALENPLYFDYTQSPRVAVLKSKKFTLKNGFLDVSDISTVFGTRLFLTRLISPLVEDITIIKGNNAGIVVRSCYESRIIRPSIHNLTDDESRSLFGYGIDDSSSYATLVSDGDFSNTRHAYTTNTSSIDDTSDLSKYGATMYGKVVNCTCTGNNDDAFDTHPNAYFTTFENVIGIRNLKGLVKDRGKFTVVSCESYGDGFGVRTSNRSDNMTIKSIVSEGTFRPLFLDTGVESRVKLIGGHAFVNIGNEPIRLVNTRLSGDFNVTFTSSDDFSKIFRMDNAELNLGSLSIDIKGSVAPNIRLIEIASGDSNSVKISKLVVDSVIGQNSVVIVRNAGVAGTTQAVIRDAELESFYTLSGPNAYSQNSGASVSYLGGSSESFSLNIDANNQFIPQLLLNSASYINFTANMNNGQKLLAALSDGVFQGQRLKITVSKSSTSELVVRHGSSFNTDLISQVDEVISPTQSINLVWSGSVWEEVV